jgi:hypothetical protein
MQFFPLFYSSVPRIKVIIYCEAYKYLYKHMASRLRRMCTILTSPLRFTKRLSLVSVVKCGFGVNGLSIVTTGHKQRSQ